MNFADQIMQALLGQQMQASQVEVDEMGIGAQQQADEMAQIEMEGQQPVFKTGMEALHEAMLTDKKKKQEEGYVPFGY